MTSTTTMNVRIGFFQRRNSALSISGYRSVRVGFENNKPVFEDQRVQLVAFDAIADQLTVVRGARARFEVQQCQRKSDGSVYLKIVGQVQPQATQTETAPVEAPATEPQPVSLDDLELDRLLELVRETEAPEASTIQVMASMNVPEARRRAVNLLRTTQGASFVAA